MKELEGGSAEWVRAARRTIVVGGLLAGALDLTWACVQTTVQGRQPARMLQSIASGVLGSAAYDSGRAAMALGILLHFTIAFGACATYFLASWRWPQLHRHHLLAGSVYGLGVYFFMQTVVLPLSRIGYKFAFPPRNMLLGFAAHILCVGLPIAWAARRFAARPRP